MKFEIIVTRLSKLSLLLLFLVFLLIMPGSTLATNIPDDRIATWQGNVGVEGGIPIRNKEINCVMVYGAHADGKNTANEINACLNGISSGEVAYLPPGTYTVSSSIMLRTNKTLRGAGPDLTIIRSIANVIILVVGDKYTDCSSGGISIISGYTKGSNQIVLANASAISVGNHLYLDELNNANIPVNPQGTGGSPWYNSCYSGGASNRNRAQIVKVIAKNGNTLNIDPPMYFTFSSTNSPLAHKTPSYVEYAGVENLTVKHGGSFSSPNIQLQGATNCWCRNIKVDTLGKRGVNIYYDGFRNEIRDSYFSGCVDQYNSDTCYGVHINGSSANLIENNIFENTANGIVVVASSGNVFGYNYSYGVHRTKDMEGWFWADTWTHGSHSSYNLWEGNEFNGINWDDYWGSSSHNTVYRNRLRGKDPSLSYTGLSDNAPIIDATDNRHNTMIANVLGTSGFSNTYEVKNVSSWYSRAIYASGVTGKTDAKVFATQLRHMNYDYVTNGIKYCDDVGEPGCQGWDGNRTLPSSLYLVSKPSFYGSCPWPSFGPDLNPMINTLPAKARYEGLTVCGDVGNSTLQAPRNLRIFQ